MKQVRIFNQKNSKMIGSKINVATSIIDRTKGLMFSKNMNGQDGLLIRSCNSVHTCFMHYPIDIVFLDKNEKVVKCVKNKKPWRFTLFYLRASSTLELPVGAIEQFEINDEDQLRVEYV
jgi:uncharacterized membrane protein (UPF0127 family)